MAPGDFPSFVLRPPGLGPESTAGGGGSRVPLVAMAGKGARPIPAQLLPFCVPDGLGLGGRTPSAGGWGGDPGGQRVYPAGTQQDFPSARRRPVYFGRESQTTPLFCCWG